MLTSRAYGPSPVDACQHGGMRAGTDAEAVLAGMVDAVVAGDAEGRVTLWSRGAERMFGWRADDVLGQRFSLDHNDDALTRVRAGENVSRVTKIRRSDGGLLDVWAVLSPVRERADGEVVGWVAVVRDATTVGVGGWLCRHRGRRPCRHRRFRPAGETVR